MEIAIANKKESIILKKDSFQETAIEEYPKKPCTDKPGRHWLPFLYSSDQAEDCIREGYSKLRELGTHGGWPPEPNGDDADFLARLFSSSSRMELPKRRERPLRNFSFPIGTRPLIQERRSRIATRLCLLRLNFLLIPTRIRHILRHNFRDPYGKSIITNRGQDQLKN